MPDVFLSYSSRDREAAEQIQQALTARGIDVFWDQETPPGQDWDTWIRGKLTACKVAIVMWSRASIQSPNVKHEAIVARDAHKLVPVMIEKLKPSDFPMGLYLVQAVDLTDWRNPDGKGMARLVAEIETRTGLVASAPTSGVPKPAQRKINWVGVAIGILAVAGATALTQWIYSPKTTPAAPGLTSLPCSNGLPRLSTGECPGFDPSRVLTPTAECLDGSTAVDGVCANGNRPIPPAPVLGAGDGGRAMAGGLASQLAGRWHWEGQACENGTTITLVGGQLTFATQGETPFTHRIDSDTLQEIRTTIVSPDSHAGQDYSFKPEYVATSDPRNFNLVIAGGGERNVWYPCPAQ